MRRLLGVGTCFGRLPERDKAVIESGACRRLAELFKYSLLSVQMSVLRAIVSYPLGSGSQTGHRAFECAL